MRYIFTLFAAFLLALCSGQDLEQITQVRQARNFRTSSGNVDWKKSNVDFVSILPGKTLTLADLKGPGVIRRIWLTILPSEPGYARLMTIRIYWDGEKLPSVESPLGDFFGVGHGLDAVLNSIPVRNSADGRARSCNWVMPFRKSVRVTVTNDGTLATWGFYYQVDGDYENVASEAPYFHASYRQAFPCKPGNYVVADITGKGQYVGTVLSTRSTTEGWWGEGNDYFFVDGEPTPSLRGTGMEDYFGEAWALRKTDGPYEGCSVFEGGFTGARDTCYRWHVPDPIHFTRSLRVEFQHMGVGQTPSGEWRNDIERPDEFSSVGYWYQTGVHAPYPPLPSGPDRMPFDYRRFIDAEKLTIEPPASGKVAVVKILGLHGDADIEWTGPTVGTDLSLPFTVSKAGRYQIMVLVCRRADGGYGKFFVDDKPLSDRVSFYSADDQTLQEIPLEFSTLSAGKHLLKLRCLGQPPEAQGPTWYAVDGFIVQPER